MPEPAAPVVPLGLRGGVVPDLVAVRQHDVSPGTLLPGPPALAMAERRASMPASGAGARPEVALVKGVGLVLALAGGLVAGVVVGAAALWGARANAGAS